jgi:hypothetical protein
MMDYAVKIVSSKSSDMGEIIMQIPEREAFIVGQFAQYRTRDDIILAVCDKYEMKWPEAEALVREVEIGGAEHIQSQRMPLLRIIAIIIIVGGACISLGMVFLGLSGVSFHLRWLPIPFSGNIILFVVGLAMMLGSIRGLIDTMKAK